jgi:hypothetical protein
MLIGATEEEVRRDIREFAKKFVAAGLADNLPIRASASPRAVMSRGVGVTAEDVAEILNRKFGGNREKIMSFDERDVALALREAGEGMVKAKDIDHGFSKRVRDIMLGSPSPVMSSGSPQDWQTLPLEDFDSKVKDMYPGAEQTTLENGVTVWVSEPNYGVVAEYNHRLGKGKLSGKPPKIP